MVDEASLKNYIGASAKICPYDMNAIDSLRLDDSLTIPLIPLGRFQISFLFKEDPTID